MIRPRSSWAAGLLAGPPPPSSLGARVQGAAPEGGEGGSEPQGDAWAEVPDTFKGMKIPDWTVPLNGGRRQPRQERATRSSRRLPRRDAPAAGPGQGGSHCPGGPRRVHPGAVRVPQRRRHGPPGVLPPGRTRRGRGPAVVALHGHGQLEEESVCTDPKNGQLVGPLLAKRGYVVAGDMPRSTAGGRGVAGRRMNATVRREVARFRGSEVKSLGDGFLILFDGPARAIHCAKAITEATAPLGIKVRAGLHTGEVERTLGCTRYRRSSRRSHYGHGECERCRHIPDCERPCRGLRYRVRRPGEHSLKGIEERWQLFKVRTIA